MINLNMKRKILLNYTKGKSISEIVKIVGSSRNTIIKYINEYDNTIRNIIESSKTKENIENKALNEEFRRTPKYDVSNRSERKLSYKMKLDIDKKLKENDIKRRTGHRKMIMNNIDIHKYLEEEGYIISYTTVSNYIRKKLCKKV